MIKFGIICLFFQLFTKSYGYYLTLDANAEECFFDRLTVGTKMMLYFEVVEGGFLDIDVKVYGPDSKVMYSGERETSGRYALRAHVDGVYKYCFNNKLSTVTPKILMFNFDIQEKQRDKDISTDAQHNQLEDMVFDLSNSLITVKHQQEYMEAREKVHRTINDNTNSRVVLWAAFEAFLLLSMSIGQIYYLRRFFEVRRMV